MAGLFDWLSDASAMFGGGGSTDTPPPMPPVQPLDTAPPTAPSTAAGMPPVQPLDMTTGPGTAGQDASALPPPGAVPLPRPRPAAADAAPVPAPAPTAPPGPPLNIAPSAPAAPPPSSMPAQTWLGRALGITPDQAGQQGQQIAAGLGAGLKAIGQGAGVGQGKFAAFAGGMGNAMEGAKAAADKQQKQAADYLKQAIDAKKAGDEAGYKQNYLQYLAAKLKADTDKAASSTAANKNDTPTQLYLSAQRLVEPDRKAMNTELQQMRKDGADPAAIAKRQAELDAEINAKLANHYATLGIHPQTAAQIAQQPGNSLENPVDAGKLGITKDNIGQRLQPGQYFRNPSDGKIYRYKGKGDAGKGAPGKPTSPEPPNPMQPYKTPLDSNAQASAADLSSEGDED